MIEWVYRLSLSVILIAAISVAASIVREWNLASASTPAAASSNATVERRIHLTLDTRYDTDKRRTFECREVKP